MIIVIVTVNMQGMSVMQHAKQHKRDALTARTVPRKVAVAPRSVRKMKTYVLISPAVLDRHTQKQQGLEACPSSFIAIC